MDLREEKTQDSIEESLIGLLHEKPFDRITVSELCGRARISRTNFYRHYQNKEQLFLDVVSRKRTELQRNVLEGYHELSRTEETATSASKISFFCRCMTNELLDLIEAHAIILKRQSLSPEFAATLYITAERIAQDFARFLESIEHASNDEETIDNDALNESARKTSSQTAAIASFYIFGLIGLIASWSKDGLTDRKTLLDQVDALSTGLLEALPNESTIQGL